MKIAWFSPLNPQASGIADYSEELLPALSRLLDIDIYIDPAWKPDNPAISEHFRIRPYSEAAFPSGEYDQIVYHMGNDYSAHRYIYKALQRFPGVVVLHDLVLMGFYAAQRDAQHHFPEFIEFLQRFYPQRSAWIAETCGGRHPFPIWEGELVMQMPMHEEVCRKATALITHSRFVLERLGLPVEKPGAVIPHHGHPVRTVDRRAIRQSLGVSDQELLLVSVGYVTNNKRYELILEGLAELGNGKLRYLIAGRDQDGKLKRLLSAGRNDVLTRGFAPLPELESWIAAADIGINLRNPTMGESSGSLLRMLSYGLPVLVSDIGSYAEIPDYCVVKIAADMDEREMLKTALAALAGDTDLRHSLGREAAAYAGNTCGIGRCAQLYADFLAGLPRRTKEVS